MSSNTRFPLFRWVLRKLSGHWARRVYVVILLALLCLTTVARLRAYFMTRKIHAVLRGLSEVRVDETTAEQLLKSVPHVSRAERQLGPGNPPREFFRATISNESDWAWLVTRSSHADHAPRLPDWLGYRYLRFDATVLIEDGKVSQVRYGLASDPYTPQATVSAESVHGLWLPYRMGFSVSSEEDENPQYRPSGDEKGLRVIYTYDAPAELKGRAFQLDLSCFWGLRGCTDAREIARAVWQDVERIRRATLERLRAGKCPDSIIEGRMRYLPDVSVSLLEVVGSRRIEVNEEGDRVEDWFTDYRVVEVLRGGGSGFSRTMRYRRAIPFPEDATRRMANQVFPPTGSGEKVLFFGNPRFYSCRIVPATPSALAAVRDAPVPPKRPEDQIATH